MSLSIGAVLVSSNPFMPKGNIVAANELPLLMPTGHDFATFLVRLRSPGVRTVNYV